MSCSEGFVREHKLQTDRAIHRAYLRLASDAAVLETFDEILYIARKRAGLLFTAPVSDGCHLGVEALVNLSRFRGEHIRRMADWPGASSSWRPALASLADHLLCRYPVPRFLVPPWSSSDASADSKRRWFIEHSRGRSFRSLDLPMVMTRRIEHIFLASPDHLPIEYAMRRAELLGLGARADFVKAVMSTRLAADLRHGEFWRTFFLFLITNAKDVEAPQIGPMIDYIEAIRHERVRVETIHGIAETDPPQPTFSLKGRTVQSVLKSMQIWHKSLSAGGAGFSWARASIEPLLLEEPRADDSEAPKRWQMMELTDSAQLRREGATLHHCVASYAYSCQRGTSSIWSLRLWRGETFRPVLTVEVDPKRRAVVQARGLANRNASGKSLQLVRDWASRERLEMAL